MEVEDVAPLVGSVACGAVVAALVAPFVLLSDVGTELGLYYAAGPAGVTALGFLAPVAVVVFLAGRRGRTDPVTAAGLTLVLGLGMLGLAASWALAVDPQLVFNFSAAWMGNHRWVVLGVTALVPLSAAAYARAVL
ncbi:hypothetical protein C2R22_06370 [Salinigranum rubrum]|uniref:Uncharacterized protein n=1 Tax=Salinigranum rubrum TaxID=755307 RepID=A0A2I8VHC0_9EURY|nr:hypothetical protein [Salinigranum rubrum]AUV81333.1 hypothetical protein C2R22_06370 [Salinigranum rubrum]